MQNPFELIDERLRNIESLLIEMKNTKIQNIPIQKPDLIGRKEASKILGISITSLWKYTKSGQLKSYKIGSRILYKRSEITQLETKQQINIY